MLAIFRLVGFLVAFVPCTSIDRLSVIRFKSAIKSFCPSLFLSDKFRNTTSRRRKQRFSPPAAIASLFFRLRRRHASLPFFRRTPCPGYNTVFSTLFRCRL
jgi:hypothetical protein